jgi:hypothetical protein
MMLLNLALLFKAASAAKAIILCCQCRTAIGGRLEVRKTDLAIGC